MLSLMKHGLLTLRRTSLQGTTSSKEPQSGVSKDTGKTG